MTDLTDVYKFVGNKTFPACHSSLKDLKNSLQHKPLSSGLLTDHPLIGEYSIYAWNYNTRRNNIYENLL